MLTDGIVCLVRLFPILIPSVYFLFFALGLLGCGAVAAKGWDTPDSLIYRIADLSNCSTRLVLNRVGLARLGFFKTSRQVLRDHHGFQRLLISDEHAGTFGGDQHLGSQFGQGPGNGLACYTDNLSDL